MALYDRTGRCRPEFRAPQPGPQKMSKGTAAGRLALLSCLRLAEALEPPATRRARARRTHNLFNLSSRLGSGNTKGAVGHLRPLAPSPGGSLPPDKAARLSQSDPDEKMCRDFRAVNTGPAWRPEPSPGWASRFRPRLRSPGRPGSRPAFPTR